MTALPEKKFAAEAICPILTAARIMAEGPASKVQTAVEGAVSTAEYEAPSVRCIRGLCKLYIGTEFDKQGRVIAGSCGLALVPSAVMAVANNIARAAGLFKDEGQKGN